MRFVGIKRPEDFRTVARAHVIAWRKTLEKQKQAPATVRRKLSALSDLDYLCQKNAVPDNPVHGVERPKEGANQGKTPAISDAQAAALLEAPPRGDPVRVRSGRPLKSLLDKASGVMAWRSETSLRE
jgi:site-specific recombinase XerD